MKKTATATNISIDYYEKLNPLLREFDTMVFRLGSSPNGTGTQFALFQGNGNQLRDFFLFDDEIFARSDSNFFKPKLDPIRLLPYKILPSLSESSLVNLGLSCGLIGEALGFRNTFISAIPATTKSTFTFPLKLHRSIDQVFVHNNGQIEIDALLVENKEGQNTLFVIEAKHGTNYRTLAKHKLVYPVLALAERVPKDIPIVPVYIKIQKLEDAWHYHIAECNFPDPRYSIRAIDELRVGKYSHWILPFKL